jgi:hypothetical protein
MRKGCVQWLAGIVILIALSLFVLPFFEFYYSGAWSLAVSICFGWISFLYNTLPRVQIDSASIFTFIVCLTAFAGLVHFFGRVLYTHVTAQRGEAQPWRAKWSAAIVCASVLLFAAGMSGVGLFYSAERVALSKEPWISSSRISAAKIQSSVLMQRAEEQQWSATQLRAAIHEYLADQDGSVRFLVLEDSKGEWRALVGYEPEHLYRAVVQYRDGRGRLVDLRVDDLEEIAARGN